jgi:hypothetical protein
MCTVQISLVLKKKKKKTTRAWGFSSSLKGENGYFNSFIHFTHFGIILCGGTGHRMASFWICEVTPPRLVAFFLVSPDARQHESI